MRNFLLLIVRKLLYVVEPKRNLHDSDHLTITAINERVAAWRSLLAKKGVIKRRFVSDK